MHIGFDISQTGRAKAGCGFFAHAMAGALLEEAPGQRYSFYPSFGDFYFDALMPLRSPYRGRDVRYGPRHLTRDAAGAFWSRPDLEAALGSPDVVHANNFWCPVQLSASRLVYTCYDLGFVVQPDWTTEANRVGCFEGSFRAAAVADWIVAISHATRDHFLRLFPHFPADRVRVIHPCSRFGPDQAETRPPSLGAVAPGGFWLNVGTIEPRKNQERLARAYRKYASQAAAPMPLVLAGGRGWLMDDFTATLRELGIDKQVIMTGYVSDEELAWLYRNCYANLYPSLFEGFGLPVLEGMQFGAPSIVSSSSSLPEVAGDAAMLIEPLDVDGWAAALIKLAADPALRRRLAHQAVAQAARFDRHASARALLALYGEAIASPRRAAALAA